jgi:aminoglycoside phosphotransferase (APT) family kinase protein
MESKTKNKKTRAQIEAMALRAFNGMGLAAGEDAVLELKGGWFNAAYTVKLAHGREVILKIAPNKDAEVMTYEKNLMLTEVDAMRRVRQNPAIPVPEIYYYDQARDLCDSDYFFMEKVHGNPLEHAKVLMLPKIRKEIDFQIGAILREINGFGGAYFGYEGNRDLSSDLWKDAFVKIVDSLLEDGRRKNIDYKYETDEIHAAVISHAAALEAVTTPQLVHWDAWDPNIFVKDGRVTGIIDFERALWGDPLLEAQFRTSFGKRNPNFLRGYEKTQFTRDEEIRSQLYNLHLALVMYTECTYRNYDTNMVLTISKQMLKSAMKWLQKN